MGWLAGTAGIVLAALALATGHWLAVQQGDRPIVLSREAAPPAAGGDTSEEPPGAAVGAAIDAGSESGRSGSSISNSAGLADAMIDAGDAQSGVKTGEGYVGLAGGRALFDEMLTGARPIWFFDTRPTERYDEGAIQFAESMPATRLSRRDGFGYLDALGVGFDDPLVLYCTGGDCSDSENAAILLEQRGYTNITIMTAGYRDWREAGFPTTEGG
ncbi:MAG: rhodanese-like domain-containing protein [Planctomycetota bacterium]